jgi:hypothetical protein
MRTLAPIWILGCALSVLPLACSKMRCAPGPVSREGPGPFPDPFVEATEDPADGGVSVCAVVPTSPNCIKSKGVAPGVHVRCEATDPDCGPAALPGQCWRPSAPRKLVHPDDPRDPIRARSRCTYDGECVRGGCGNMCVGYKAPAFATTCEMTSELEHALCGCVQGYCNFFVQ